MNETASAVISLAERHLGEFRIRNNQLVADVCPFCGGGRNGDLNTFAIGLYNGAFSCLRGSCGKKGSFKELCNFFGERSPEDVGFQTFTQQQPKQKTYDRPNFELLPVTEEIETYFAKRRISRDTLDQWHISADEKGNIVFPFFRNNELTFVKFRDPKRRKDDKSPKEWQMQNTEPILFGMDMVSFNKPLVITEGEIDALSVYEAGWHNVVSVPCGCNNMEWITLCWDWLEKFNQIIVLGDNDDPGITMVQTVMKRLGEDRCMLPQQYPELKIDEKDYNRLCKDANEILYAYGPEYLYHIVEACEPAPIKGVINLADVQFVDPSSVPRIFTRIPQLDNAIGGLGESSVTVFTGKRGEGKSTLNGSLLLNAIQQGYSVCAYSGELSKEKFLEWILLQATEDRYIGVTPDQRTGKLYPSVSPEIQKRIKEWINNKFFLFDNAWIEEANQQDAIMKVFNICARRYGCKLFLVDNLMIALTSSDEENRAQAKFAAALKSFAAKYKVAVILVAHPRKTKAGEALTNDDVSGSSAITNLADNVIAVEKPNLRITKNRDFGVCDYIECSYNPANRRIYQTSAGDGLVYGWDHNGIEEPEQKACDLPDFEIQVGGPISGGYL